MDTSDHELLFKSAKSEARGTCRPLLPAGSCGIDLLSGISRATN